MQGAMLFKKFLMPCGLCAAVPVVKPKNPPPDCPANCNNDSQNKKLIRPSELPIYTMDDECSSQMPCAGGTPSALQQQVSNVRKSLQNVMHEYQGITSNVSNTIDTGYEHGRALIDYVRDETSPLPRIGAIGIGGLTGLMLGLRGGKFKKLVYTSIGAATAGAICYPEKAEEGYNMAKHYANISYNFIYGVKPGDGKQLELALPELPKLKMPSSFSEFLQLAVDTGSAAATAVTSLAEKTLNAVNEKKEESPKAPESGSK